MQHGIKVFTMAGLIMLCVIPSSTTAQKIRVGPQIGLQKARDADTGNLLGGAALRLKLLPSLGVEGSIMYRQEQYFDGEATVRTWPVMATGMLYVFPFIYGAAGLGFYHTTIDYPSDLNALGIRDNTKEKVGWHFGGGTEIPLPTGAVLTGDIRYVFLNLNLQDLPNREHINSDFYMITAGFLFNL